ncbi:MAG: alpha/beta hydrolase [Acidobacteria bacterium]|nr:alpha/beta hydrolase [Acidobacteriota bacterium]
MPFLCLAFAALGFALPAPVHFEKPGMFLDVKQGDSRLQFRLPVAAGENYTRAVAEFKMHIGQMQPVFNCFVAMIRPGAKGYYAMQLRADKSKMIVDKMNGTQYGEVAPWKSNTDYRVRVDYNAAAGRLIFDAWELDGKQIQHLETPIIFRAIEDAGQGLMLTFGLDRVYDHAYYPPWTWNFSDLSVTLTPGPSPYTREMFTYKQAAGCDLAVDVYRAPGAGPHPAVLWLHGGALIFGHKGNLPRAQMMRYVDAGFTVVAADYRLGPETKLPEIVADVRDAWQWLRETGPSKLGIDPNRIAVVGHSAGAYLTQLLGIVAKPAPRALVSFYGYNDITAEWCRSPGQFSTGRQVPEDVARSTVGTRVIAGTNFSHQRWQYYTYLRQHAAWVKEIGGFEPTDLAAAKPYCPLFNLTAAYPPVLLIHGDQDTDVPVSQSEEMDRALTKLGVRHQFLKLAGKPHAFDGNMSDPEVSRLFDRVIAFLEEQFR